MNNNNYDPLEPLMRVKVAVTRKDIDRGRRCDGRRCPVAAALRRKVKERIGVRVYISKYSIWDRQRSPTWWDSTDLPKKATRFIYSFDDSAPKDKKSLKPFSFVASIPRSFLR